MSDPTMPGGSPTDPQQQPAGGWPAPDQHQQPDAGAQQVDPSQFPPPQGYAPDQYAGYPDGGQEQPPAKKKRTGLIAGLVSGGVLLVLIIAGVIGFVVIGASHNPQTAASSYLDALKSGDAATALKLSGMKASGKDPLLTNKAYRSATNRISRFTVRTSKTHGTGATVAAVITQGGKQYSQSFELVKHGKDMLFFDHWQLRPVPLAKATVEVNAPSGVEIKVAGVAVKPTSGRIRLNAFPGTYSVTVTNTDKWYKAELNGASSTSVVGFTSGAQQPAEVKTTLTDAGKQSATDAVNKYIDGCAASTAFKPEGCGFGLTGSVESETYSNQKWTIDPRPAFTIGEWTGSGWDVRTDTPGAANFSGDFSSAAGTGTISGGPIDVRVRGTVTLDDSGATYKSDPFF